MCTAPPLRPSAVRAQKTCLARGLNRTPPPASYSLITSSDQPLVSQVRHPDTTSGTPTPPHLAPQHAGQKAAVLLGGRLDGAAVRNQVTSSLMAITVIIVGVVNCFLLGLMRWGGAAAMQLGRPKEAREFWERRRVSGGARTGGGSRQWTAGLNCQSGL